MENEGGASGQGNGGQCEDTASLDQRCMLLLGRNWTFSTFAAAEYRNGDPNQHDRFGGLGMLAHENIAPVSTPRKLAAKSELEAHSPGA